MQKLNEIKHGANILQDAAVAADAAGGSNVLLRFADPEQGQDRPGRRVLRAGGQDWAGGAGGKVRHK